MKKTLLLFGLMSLLINPMANANNSTVGSSSVNYFINEETATNYLSIETADVKAGETFVVPVQLTNDKSMTAFQCDIYLPEGMTMVFDEEEEAYDITLEDTRITSSHSLTSQDQPDGSIRVACYSSKSKDFKGNSGNLFYMKIATQKHLSGESAIKISNIIFSTSTLESVTMSDIEGKVNVIPLINKLTAADTTAEDCYSLRLPVSLYNEATLSAFQCDVYLPEGVSIATDSDDEYDITLEPSRCTSSHSITAQKQEDGAIRLACYSTKSSDFIGSEGNLFYMNLQVEKGAIGKDLKVELKNIIASSADLQSYEMEETYCTITITHNSYKLTYMVDNAEYKSEDIVFDSAITAQEEPTKEGHTFSGWSEIPETMPAQDVTVTGHFTPNKYLVTYVIGEETIATDSVVYATSITTPSAPEKEGYTFAGWAEVPETMPAQDVTITGSYTINSYTITYKVDGEVLAEETLEYGAAIEAKDAPEKEGHTFSGWSETPETMPAGNVEITGHFTANKYLVTFVIDEETIATDSVVYATSITTPSAPEKEGYTFAGWTDVPETMPAQDVTITGSYTINSYTITYKVDGEIFAEETLEYGAAITQKEEPVKEGHTFSGWSETPETMPAGNVEITGSFTVNSYTIKYVVDGEVIETVSCEYGTEIVVLPLAPEEKEGYTFTGWTDVPETMPAHDIEITGSYTVNSYTITYMIDGKVYAEETLEYGATIVPAAGPDDEDYIFSGWSEIPETMPAHDLVITGELTPVGISAIITTPFVDVYRLDGTLVKKNIPTSKLNQELGRGMYIINRQKVYIK